MSDNPYQSPTVGIMDAIPVTVDDTPPSVLERLPRLTKSQGSFVLLASFVATTFAGAFFGILGGIAGVLIGGFLACITGLLVFGVLLLSNSASTSRDHLPWAATLGGGLTGWLSVVALSGGDIFVASTGSGWMLSGMTAAFGAVAAGVTAWTVTLHFLRANERTARSAVRFTR